MHRGAKASKARVESKLPVARKPRKNEGSRGRDLENRGPRPDPERPPRVSELTELDQQKTRHAPEAADPIPGPAISRMLHGAMTPLSVNLS